MHFIILSPEPVIRVPGKSYTISSGENTGVPVHFKK
jgi:hypothetical protein